MRYTYHNDLGHGGFAKVGRYFDNINNCFVALKIYDPVQAVLDHVDDLSLKRRFVREVNYQSAMNNPNVVSIIDSFLESDPPFFSMPLANCSLEDELDVDPTLGENLNTVLFDILNGLEGLHNAGYTHRDLKPANVLKFSSDNAVSYAISDFGLMNAINSASTSLTGTNATGGTALYAAPELMGDFRRATFAADIYSFGAILHDVFSGRASRVPYSEITYPGPIGAIISKCTKTLPIRRYGSIAILREELYRVLTSSPIEFSSRAEERIVGLLNSGRVLDDQEWDSVFIFLERANSNSERHKVLSAITIEHINFHLNSAPELFTALGDYFSDVMFTESFDFDYCDILASKAEVFFNSVDLGLKAKIILALLELGTSHNRWYVERKVALMMSNMTDELNNRLVTEINTTNFDFSGKIIHMERSINYNRAVLPIELQQLVR
ncbi:putative serine/threonine protein kinase [Pseudescherichia vulneris NBRC 102420]|uniref:Putative serine/threonine protein kinase n=1 Tax=Pseudescherichia vulneris NBRC 102420 TaxID=1115515 RepID=A0A090V5X3_PSEVU|nr:serine/threonine-protein kinase [Pseudescherichia vulneris]GAL60211.1 putative serine/threonine protein kinase [Pseudescherichia vulneris NBRC 102420]STQ58545.1 protein kinase from phage origin [Pseudescherichia vulneris]